MGKAKFQPTHTREKSKKSSLPKVVWNTFFSIYSVTKNNKHMTQTQNSMANQNSIMDKVMTLDQIAETAMKSGIVKFVYTKVDGSRRVAYGTKDMDTAIECGYVRTESKSTRTIDTERFLVYFDIERNDFRMCYRSKVTEICNPKMSIVDAYVDCISSKPMDERVGAEFELLVARAVTAFNSADSGITFNTESKSIVKERTATTQSGLGARTTQSGYSSSEPTLFEQDLCDMRRSDLIKELVRIRQRESEILTLLLQ